MSLVHWLVVILVIIVIFGAGRLPSVMGDIAEGIKAFKRGMKDEDTSSSPPKRVADDNVVENQPAKDKTEV